MSVFRGAALDTGALSGYQFPMDMASVLGRPERPADSPDSAAALAGRTVLVTGAAGSIGSALCEALSELRVGRLILLDRAETGLVELHRRLGSTVPVEVVLGDVSDAEFVRRSLTDHRPDVVYHGAALKHVVLLEDHPLAAAETNVLGAWNVLHGCEEAGVDDVVLLSTDKVVKPSSFMGATKNVAERIWRSPGSGSTTRRIIVRLVNVAGSGGSLIPRLERQAAQREPLTLSDADATRWFVSEREAVAILTAASWLGDSGDVLMPSLASPRRVGDVADAIINLTGADPDRISVTGLGPGEKLHESLWGAGEVSEATDLAGVSRIRSQGSEAEVDLTELRLALRRSDRAALIASIRRLVPEYNPSERITRVSPAAEEDDRGTTHRRHHHVAS